MISKEEFLNLYEKWLNNQCTPEELAKLNSYSDDMKLLDGDWDQSVEVRGRLWRRLKKSRGIVEEEAIEQRSYLTRKFFLVRAASILLVIGSVLLIFKNTFHKSVVQNGSNKIAQQKIMPGGNKAYLTMANGKRIALNDTKNGLLANQSGIKVTKSKNGILVYHFSDVAANATDTTTQYNTIETPRGGQYQVVLDDGTQVWLNAMSKLKFPIAFRGSQRRVELSGEAYFEVAKNKEKPFFVRANGNVIRVLGTHFNVSAYEDDREMTTTLLEGSVELRHNALTTLLSPGQQGKIKPGTNRISVGKADMDEVMAWKNGLFIFPNGENIVDVMKTVSRWYDIEVVYQGNVKDREFGGTISKYKNITELLDNMELTQAIHYKIEGRRVTIMD